MMSGLTLANTTVELALATEAAMTWGGWATIGVILLVLALLASNRVSTDVAIVGGVTILLLLDFFEPGAILSVREALGGMSNEGMITVAILYVVVAGLQHTGAVSWLSQRMLGRPKTLLGAQARIILPTAMLSAFLNNTPIVAMLIPAITEWARKHRLSVSKLMIPLSYAAIFGGTCTLIGTSTNLVVSGLWYETSGERFGLFSIAWIGVPCMIAGTLYLLFIGRFLLPDRKPPISESDDPRSYTVEMMVDPGGPLVGQTIEEAGLRNLAGLYLAEIDREGQVIPAVGPTTRLRGDDRLVFVGVVDSIVDLQRMRGLTPATDQVFKLDAPRSQRCLIEAVVSDSCSAVGKSIRDARFRTIYNAVVIAVARNGERILNMKIGDIVLRAGDTLLLEARPSFAEQQRDSRDFYLVSRIENSSPPRHERAILSVGIFVGMIVLVTVLGVPIIIAAMVAAGLMIISRCVPGSVARKSVDWQVLIVIAASFALGRALHNTGAAGAIAHQLIALVGANPWLALVIVYGLTTLFTELITNNAAAVLMFPVALATSTELGVDFTPFAFTIMMAASASFSTPIGYQTNLMVFGPGGYKFTDYARVGLPLNLIVWTITALLAPVIWPF
jgi:di/tricarboxylate transporter